MTERVLDRINDLAEEVVIFLNIAADRFDINAYRRCP
jgi:hypothetical protein